MPQPDPTTRTNDIAARTREALLAGIYDQLQRGPNTTALLRLAEAYAWTVAPDQPHGGLTEA